ncbi:MAG: ammonium transporter [Pseudomonadota bacterium]
MENASFGWLITATALVMLMQAGFALVESGSTRTKNAVNVMMKNYMDLCVGSIAFWLIGFGLMFGANSTGWIGTSEFMPTALAGGDAAFLLFQTVFAATAMTIASGAMAERTSYVGYVVSAALVCAVIYPVLGSWVWGGANGGSGWLADLGFIDFAGSTVVHSTGGWLALAGVLVLGPRAGRFGADGSLRAIPGHNLNSVALGGFLLWFGWFGFNAGGVFDASDAVGGIVLNTHLAACAGAVGALIADRFRNGKPLLTVTVNGSLGGLVGITAGCANLDPGSALIVGILAGTLVVAGEQVLVAMRIDDVVGAIPVHGFCGVWGTLAAGLFGRDTWMSVDQLGVQALGAGVCFLWVFPLSYLMFVLIDSLFGLRVDALGEQRGLDFAEHAEVGYPEFQQNVLHAGRDSL